MVSMNVPVAFYILFFPFFADFLTPHLQGQLDAIWSPDGREIVTQRHLEQQLRAAIASHGGRLAILDLPDLLNVELRHIERIVYDSSKKSSYTLHQGDLITAAYLDRICVEINDVLSDRGSVSLFELAKRFDLDTAFLVQVITPKIGNVIKGSVDRADGILYTEQFLTTQRAKVRGAMFACTKPTTLNSLATLLKLQFTTIQEHARGLIATGEVQGELSSGSLRASKRDTTPTFIPTIYKTARSEWIRNFFRMNGYIGAFRLNLSTLAIQLTRRVFRQRCSGTNRARYEICGAAFARGITPRYASSAGNWLGLLTLSPSYSVRGRVTWFPS
jgi:hypothetical protein